MEKSLERGTLQEKNLENRLSGKIKLKGEKLGENKGEKVQEIVSSGGAFR